MPAGSSAIIIGATGLVGRERVRQLAAHHHHQAGRQPGPLSPGRLRLPLRAAEFGLAAGVRHFLLVSSVANRVSRSFYLRVKGELEAAIEGLGFRSVTIVRPSLPLGDRNELRLAEEVAKRLSWAFPRKYRPVHARDVAAALIAAAAADRPGVNLIENPAIAR